MPPLSTKDTMESELRKSLQIRSKKTVSDITQATEDLLNEKEGHLPTIRDLVLKSGYSIGTVYRYFATADSLYTSVFIDRFLRKNLENIEKTIEQFSPYDDVDTFIESLVDLAFERLKRKSNTIEKYRLLSKLLIQFSKRSEELNKMLDDVIHALLQLQQENLTNTCKIMSANECRLAVRAFRSVIRSPFLEGAPMAGTEEHRKYAYEFGKALFGKVK